MTDATRRPGGTPPFEGHRTTPGVPGDAQDTGAGLRGDAPTPGAREEAARETSDTRDGALGTRTDDGARETAARTVADAGGPPAAERSQHGEAVSTGAGHDGHRTAARLLRLDDTDRLTAQLQHAVAEFVDAPRDAVREADRALQELTERFTEAVTERRRTLRRSWQDGGTDDGGSVAATDTEQLRLALRDYRELAERLLHV